jgi:hypothetical protein
MVLRVEPATINGTKRSRLTVNGCHSAALRQPPLSADNPTSARGAQRKYQTGGPSASALIPDIRSRETPELRRRYGIAVVMKEKKIP